MPGRIKVERLRLLFFFALLKVERPSRLLFFFFLNSPSPTTHSHSHSLLVQSSYSRLLPLHLFLCPRGLKPQRPTAPLPPISPLPLPFALFSPSPAAPLFGSASAIRTPDLSPSSSRPFPWDSRSPTVRLRRGEERDTGAQRLLFFFGLLRGGQPPSSHASNRARARDRPPESMTRRERDTGESARRATATARPRARHAQRPLFFFGLLRGGQPPSSHASNRPAAAAHTTADTGSLLAGLGHTTLSIPHLVRSGKSSIVGRG